ncbi:DUF4270 domain-containing protein [Zunongwangia sp. F363]|uniref:DUF4270 domain-containing protein n=1 Tax=Autumnicola tepida TaxID=3075595 RepID=A0ABU3C9Y0_9FLAO|nr:DUF4270 domain-containing protein [Zunongwangia sp. F363]MDT0643142.1 DUF4270 domain-containing protein [Zunongwangia sp. F363]
MNFKRLIVKIATFSVVVFSFFACDKDYSTIGGEVIENPTDVEVSEVEVTAWSRKIDTVQTNALPAYLLGVYENEIYGQSQASLVSQLSLSTANPDFGTDPVLDSVVLRIPYFSTTVNGAGTDEVEYELDSLYGSPTSPIKLSIYESGYYLNDYDPESGFEDRQRYFSHQQGLIEQNVKGEALLENDNFVPSNRKIVSYEPTANGENDTVVSAPALRLKLPVNYFKDKIIAKQGSAELTNNSNFRNYLRGLFIKAEAVNQEEGNMALLNLASADAGVTLYYKRSIEVEDEEDTLIRDSYKLNLGTNAFNTFEGEYPADILQHIAASDSIEGAENLYLKGGEGSMAVIRLFPDEAELEQLRQNNWLINEANLSFYVDQEAVEGAEEPERVYLYDLDNNRILVDYTYDTGTSTTDPVNSRTSFSSRLIREEDGTGIRYTVRITQHINNLLNEDAENVKLGLVIVPNINAVVQNGTTTANNVLVKADNEVETVPAISILSPRGTVLYGNLAGDEAKRLKLRIYYTETNQ